MFSEQDLHGWSWTLIKVYMGGLYPRTPFYTNATDSFLELLLRSNFQYVENPNEADVYISADMHEKDLQRLSTIDNNCSSFLVRNEPRIVCPLNYENKGLEKFGTVLDIGRFHQFADKSFNWPQFWPENFPETSEDRLDKVAIISGNKLSLLPGELYSLRRKCILRVEQIEHFGTSWDSNNLQRFLELLRAIRLNLKNRIFPNINSARYWFKNYKAWNGSPFDKRKCLELYKYSLVIENSADYLSEKLFDAFFSLTIPIYVGPNIAEYGIPENLVIQCEPNLAAVESGIRKASEKDYSEWCNNVKEWLDSPKTRSEWDGYVVYGKVIDEIKKRVEEVI
jgi:hypothetical protein